MAHLRLGDLDAAALSATQAARQQNSFDLVQLSAALILSATGRQDEAQAVLDALRSLSVTGSFSTLANAMHFTPLEMTPHLQSGLRRLGL